MNIREARKILKPRGGFTKLCGPVDRDVWLLNASTFTANEIIALGTIAKHADYLRREYEKGQGK